MRARYAAVSQTSSIRKERVIMTNDERSKVARNLRESRESAWDFREQLSDDGIDVFCDDQADYYLIHKAQSRR